MMKKIILLSLLISLGINHLSAQCTEDCVWPGDANANGIANHMDLLTLGLTWEAEGPIRDNPNLDWIGQEADDWAGNLPVSGINFKHSDADGNGLVSFIDWGIITDNFGKKNEKFTGLLGNNFEGDDFRAIPSQTEVSPGDVFEIDLQLGTEENPIEGIYGIGFTVSLTYEYADVTNYNFENTWLHDNVGELLTFAKNPPDSNKVFITLSRKDQLPVSGFGHFGKMEIVIVDIIDALQADSTASLPMEIKIEDIYAINEMEEELMIAGSSTHTINVKHSSQLTAVPKINHVPEIEVFPNPVSDFLNIDWGQAAVAQIQLYNANGQLIKQQDIETNASVYHLSIQDLNDGIYWLEVQTDTGVFTQKVVIMT